MNLEQYIANNNPRFSNPTYHDHTDPRIIGPGYWSYIHSRAWRARTRIAQIAFINDLRDICENFPCKECATHFARYMLDNPPEPYMGKTALVDGKEEQIGLFVWTWAFHNSVNARLRKPTMPWEMAQANQLKSGCSEYCHAAGEDLTVPTVSARHYVNRRR